MAPNTYRGEEPEISLNTGGNSNSKLRGKGQAGLHLPANRWLTCTFLAKKIKAFPHFRKSDNSPSSSQEEVEKKKTLRKPRPKLTKKMNLPGNEAYGCYIPSSLGSTAQMLPTSLTSFGKHKATVSAPVVHFCSCRISMP